MDAGTVQSTIFSKQHQCPALNARHGHESKKRGACTATTRFSCSTSNNARKTCMRRWSATKYRDKQTQFGCVLVNHARIVRLVEVSSGTATMASARPANIYELTGFITPRDAFVHNPIFSPSLQLDCRKSVSI